MAAALGVFVLTSCGEKKKELCECVKESTKMMLEKGFENMSDEPEYPEGCAYVKDMSQEDIEKQLDDKCREEIMKLIFGDFNFDDMDMGNMEMEPEAPAEGEVTE